MNKTYGKNNVKIQIYDAIELEACQEDDDKYLISENEYCNNVIVTFRREIGEYMVADPVQGDPDNFNNAQWGPGFGHGEEYRMIVIP